MNRRTFAVLAAGGIASWPGWRRASAQARVHRVGFLASSPPPPFFLDNFRAGLREQGWTDHDLRNVAFAHSWWRRQGYANAGNQLRQQDA